MRAVRRTHAAGSIFDAHDIAPAFRTAGVGMNVEAVIVVARERQLFEESPLRGSEFAARPLDDDLGLDIKLFVAGR